MASISCEYVSKQQKLDMGMRLYTCTFSLSHTHTHTHKPTHSHTFTQIHTCSHNTICTHTRTHTHTLMHILHMYTPTHTHTHSSHSRTGSSTTAPYGSLTLRSGLGAMGTLLIYTKELKLEPFCDTRFGMSEAGVACRQLGYQGAVAVCKNS